MAKLIWSRGRFWMCHYTSFRQKHNSNNWLTSTSYLLLCGVSVTQTPENIISIFSQDLIWRGEVKWQWGKSTNSFIPVLYKENMNWSFCPLLPFILHSNLLSINVLLILQFHHPCHSNYWNLWSLFIMMASILCCFLHMDIFSMCPFDQTLHIFKIPLSRIFVNFLFANIPNGLFHLYFLMADSKRIQCNHVNFHRVISFQLGLYQR